VLFGSCYGRGKEKVSETCHVCSGKGSMLVTQPAQKCPDCLCTGRRPTALGSRTPDAVGQAGRGSTDPRPGVDVFGV